MMFYGLLQSIPAILILGFGAEAEVLEPEEFKKEIIDDLVHSIKRIPNLDSFDYKLKSCFLRFLFRIHSLVL